MRNNKERALLALMTCDTQAEAAAKCGLTDRTIRLYLSDPAFQAEYKRRKRQMLTDASRQLQSSYTAAIKTLRDIAESETSADAARISAARSLLEYGLRFTETSEILVRIEELEKQTQNNDGH